MNALILPFILIASITVGALSPESTTQTQRTGFHSLRLIASETSEEPTDGNFGLKFQIKPLQLLEYKFNPQAVSQNNHHQVKRSKVITKNTFTYPQSSSVLDLQAQKISKEIKLNNGKITLTNLNPNINKWLLLTVEDSNKEKQTFHIENVFAENTLNLKKDGIKIKNSHSQIDCKLWNQDSKSLNLGNISDYKNPYYPICDGLLYVRLKRESSTKLSMTEWATEKLRMVSFGEKLINFVKPLIVGRKAEAAKNKTIALSAPDHNTSSIIKPAKTQVFNNKIPVSESNHLGFKLINNESFVRYGKWYQTKMHKHIYTSLIIPQVLDKELLKSDPDLNPIQNSEMDKLVYLTAYDLSKYSINFVHGTTYPGFGKSQKDHSNRTFHSTSGSLNMIGTVPPYMRSRTVGVFIGGFKRTHGYFKYGPHQHKYYGYIENGVVLSAMTPGLATLYTTKDNQIHLKNWPKDTNEQAALLKDIVSARQNGVMIIENSKVNPLVKSWGGGNWSGDVNGNLKTLRSAVCIQRNGNKKNLIFAAFTGATPSTVARILKAYSCESAMQLDMNAYMYLHNAIFTFNKDHKIDIEYLHTEMIYPKNIKYHRYIMDNNNRDFFYVFKKD